MQRQEMQRQEMQKKTKQKRRTIENDESGAGVSICNPSGACGTASYLVVGVESIELNRIPSKAIIACAVDLREQPAPCWQRPLETQASKTVCCHLEFVVHHLAKYFLDTVKNCLQPKRPTNLNR
ncbi:hypothetical protein GC175_07625 [bacterium]|nr:hypothetical protein [bacterium]